MKFLAEFPRENFTKIRISNERGPIVPHTLTWRKVFCFNLETSNNDPFYQRNAMIGRHVVPPVILLWVLHFPNFVLYWYVPSIRVLGNILIKRLVPHSPTGWYRFAIPSFIMSRAVDSHLRASLYYYRVNDLHLLQRLAACLRGPARDKYITCAYNIHKRSTAALTLSLSDKNVR